MGLNYNLIMILICFYKIICLFNILIRLVHILQNVKLTIITIIDFDINKEIN